MNRHIPFIMISFLLIYSLVLYGCSNNNNETTILPTNTSQVTMTTEIPSVVELELEIQGDTTASLIGIGGLEARVTSTGIIIEGHIYSLRNALVNVDMIIEYYDSSGIIIDTRERQLVLNSAYEIDWRDFEICFAYDDLAQIKKSKLIVNAYE